MTSQTNTATLTQTDGLWIVRFMRDGSFLIGEQMFGHAGAALRFCRLNGFQVSVA